MSALSSNTAPPSGVPGKKTLSQKNESVQRSAARYVCNNYNYTSSVSMLSGVPVLMHAQDEEISLYLLQSGCMVQEQTHHMVC